MTHHISDNASYSASTVLPLAAVNNEGMAVGVYGSENRLPEDVIDNWVNKSSTYNIPFISSMLGTVPYCTQWTQVNHVYFQLANTFFFLSYLAPNGMYGILYLRCTLLVGCAFFALWGWAVLCSFDAFLWNANFVAINFIHVCVLLYHLRPIKFTREVEEVSSRYFLSLL